MTTPTDPPSLIAQARDLCKAATPEPWVTDCAYDILDADNRKVAYDISDEGNMSLIITSRTLVPALAEALAEMTVEWERTEESATSYRESMVLARESATSYRESMMRAEQELADHKAKMVDLLADAYAKGRRFNDDTDDRTSEHA